MDTTSTGDKIATVSYGFGGDTVSITHDYTVISVGDISVDVTGIVVDSGDTITFTANPDPSGYDFFYTQWEKQKDGGSWESVTLDGNETETLEADEGAGEYKFRAKHTEYGAWAESETVYIAELESLEPDQGEEIDDGDGDPKTRLFVMPPATNGVVTVTATLNPEIDESKLPDGWTIEGGDGSGKLERTVDATQPSETEFTFSYNRTDSKYKTRLEIGNIEITDLDITSPASDGKWPYDPAWHDTAWEPSVNGGLIMSIALEEDIASFSFSLNRDAQIDVIAKKDELGPDGIYKLLPIINGEIGENEIEFNVGNWPSNKYYLQVDADGGLSDGDIDSKESEKFVINRLALYLQLAENIDSVDIDNNENLVVAESNIHNVTQDHLTVPIIFGNALLSRLPGGTAKVLATAASFAILISDIAELPGWVEVGNVLYFYGPWTIKKATYNFESGQYDIFKNYKIAAMEAYDFGQGIEIVLPPVDREPAQGTPQYYNDGFGPTKTDEEFKKSAWDGGYGLVPPTLNP
jgi:hypothetical protein